MRKFSNLRIATCIAIGAVAVWLLMGITDFSLVRNYHKPLFCIGKDLADDGGSGMYIGLGYSFDIEGDFMPEAATAGVTSYRGYLFGKEVCRGFWEEMLWEEVSTEVAELEGEANSPDGKYEIRLVGVNDGVTAMGLYPPESICIYDVETEKILWEDMGYYSHASLWSPEGKYLAITSEARTYVFVTIIETDTWTSWKVTLPDGKGITEYTFLPDEAWGEWEDEDTLLLTVGRGEEGDGKEQKIYRCSVMKEEGNLTGFSTEQTYDAP